MALSSPGTFPSGLVDLAHAVETKFRYKLNLQRKSADGISLAHLGHGGGSWHTMFSRAHTQTSDTRSTSQTHIQGSFPRLHPE